MENVLFVIHMFDHVHLLGFVMNAITDHIREDVSSVEDLESLMPITAKSVQYRRRMSVNLVINYYYIITKIRIQN